MARIAKLAGAPNSKAAGIELLTPLTTRIEKNQPLYIVYAETPGELNYAVSYLQREHGIIQIEQIDETHYF